MYVYHYVKLQDNCSVCAVMFAYWYCTNDSHLKELFSMVIIITVIMIMKSNLLEIYNNSNIANTLMIRVTQ